MVTAEIAGLNAKVTNPLSSILSTFAPNVIPAVPSVAVHVITPSLLVCSNPVITVSPTFIKPSFLKGLPIVAELNESSTEAAPEERTFEFSPSIKVGEAKIFAFSFFIFDSNQLTNLF